jgi:hypothetical protein
MSVEALSMLFELTSFQLVQDPAPQRPNFLGSRALPWLRSQRRVLVKSLATGQDEVVLKELTDISHASGSRKRFRAPRAGTLSPPSAASGPSPRETCGPGRREALWGAVMLLSHADCIR